MPIIQLLLRALIHKCAPSQTREHVQKRQLKKFRQLLTFAQKNSIYYRNLLAKKKIDLENCTPQDLPILTKKEVMEHFDEIVTTPELSKQKIYDFLKTSKNAGELYLNKYHITHTSGSSGEPGLFAFSRQEWITGTLPIMESVIKFKPKQKLAYIAAVGGHFAGISIAKTSGKLPWYSENRFYDINGSLPNIIAELNDYQPTFISGYPTALKFLAQAQQNGDLNIHPNTIATGGEPVSPQDQMLIESQFNAPLINLYAATEFLLMGIGKTGNSGMIMNEENLIFEINPEFTCITSLFNKTLPLIRYQMNDVLLPKENEKSPYLHIEKLIGRKEITPIFTNQHGQEDFIHPGIFMELVTKNLDRYQIVLQDKQSFTVKAAFTQKLSHTEKTDVIQSITSQIDHILAHKSMKNVRYEIKEVDTLWVDPKTGKFKLILPAVYTDRV